MIQHYKEIELSSNYKIPPPIKAILHRLQDKISSIISQKSPSSASLNPSSLSSSSSMVTSFLYPHIIELSDKGFINSHIDSIKFSGDLVAGLSLGSTRIMTLKYDHSSIISNSDHNTKQTDDIIYDMDTTVDSFDSNVRNEYIAVENGLIFSDYHKNYNHDDYTTTASSQHNYNTDETTFRRPKEVELTLQPRSLYLLTGIWRYHYSHAILPSSSKRTSVIFRNVKV